MDASCTLTFRNGNPPYSLSAEDVVPIRLRTGCEYDGVLDDVVGQLKHLAGLFPQIYAADAGTPAEAGE